MSNDFVDVLHQIEKNINKYYQTQDEEWLWQTQILVRKTRKNIENGTLSEQGTDSAVGRCPTVG